MVLSFMSLEMRDVDLAGSCFGSSLLSFAVRSTEQHQGNDSRLVWHAVATAAAFAIQFL